MRRPATVVLTRRARTIFPLPVKVRRRSYGDSSHAALARRLYQASGVRAHASVLDVGHGCGDSLLLLRDAYAPSCLHGVTSLPSQAARAQQRCGDAATVWCADAVHWIAHDPDARTSERTKHGLESPKICPLVYDYILALDCAYHFSSRASFFAHAYQRLAPGGVLGLEDLAAAWPYPRRPSYTFRASELPAPTRPPSWTTYLQHRLLCALTQTPAHAFVPIDVYVSQLVQAGFPREQIEVHDLSHAMFPGFAAFLARVGTTEERALRASSRAQRFGLRAFGRAVARWGEGGDGGLVRSVLVTARKPKSG